MFKVYSAIIKNLKRGACMRISKHGCRCFIEGELKNERDLPRLDQLFTQYDCGVAYIDDNTTRLKAIDKNVMILKEIGELLEIVDSNLSL